MNNIDDIKLKYYFVIIKMAVNKLNISYFDAIEAFYKSGIREIIESDLEVSLHRDPEEWIENIECYLKTYKNVI